MDELCAILSKVSGATFRAYAAPTYRALATELRRGEVKLAWLPPVLALALEEESIADPLAIPVRSGMTTYSAALIVRDRTRKTIDELRGTRMAWVDRESSSGYVIPRLHLSSLGHDLRGFFREESFLHSHIAVVDAVATGRVDVGATFSCSDPATGKMISAGWTSAEGATIRSVRVVSTAGPIPNDMIVASHRLPVAVRGRIQQWLLQLDDRSQELFSEIVHSTEFRVPAPEHFRPLRALFTMARSRGLLEP
jgi:phosphonate transport system substrate-binding protein